MKWLRWIVIACAIAGTVGVGVIIARDEYPEVTRLKEECESVREQVDTLTKDRDEMTREIHDLDEDPATVERLARREGWIRKGETVILIPENAKDE